MSRRSDTIAAICTPPGFGGLGVIRISGARAIPIISEIFETVAPSLLLENHRRRLLYGFIKDRQGRKLDEVLVAIMPAGRAFTGEACAEVHCHGGQNILESVLEEILQQGARLAQRGEFTRRALENGRIDLVQAEAVNDLIRAGSRIARESAWGQFAGQLSGTYQGLRTSAIELAAEIQKGIDFEDSLSGLLARCLSLAESLEKSVSGLISNTEHFRPVMQGIAVAIAGRVNVGKSSIFNEILQSERSIVSEVSGTTRDHVSESFIIEGVEARIIDTAGNSAPQNELEGIAQRKSREQIDQADIVVQVLDQSEELQKSDLMDIERVEAADGIVVMNKCDLPLASSMAELLKSKPHVLQLSAKYRINIEKLQAEIRKRILSLNSVETNRIMINARQLALLKEMQSMIMNCRSALSQSAFDAAAYEVHGLITRLEQLLGINVGQEVLDKIFQDFCLGK